MREYLERHYSAAEINKEQNEAILAEVERQLESTTIRTFIDGNEISNETTLSDREMRIDILNPIDFHNGDIGVVTVIKDGIAIRNHLISHPSKYKKEDHEQLFTQEERESYFSLKVA